MLSLLRAAVSGRLRRTLSTAAARPPWAMMYRVSQGSNSTESVSSSLAPPPSVSFVSVPSHALDIDPFPPQPKCVSLFRGLVLAASGHGLLLLDTHMSRLQAHDLKLLYRRRRMDMVHEVLDYGGRLWWVDVSWGAICVDPFSDRPELCPVELPAHSMLPDQLDENEMRQLIKHRHMGVSAGRLLWCWTTEAGSGGWTDRPELCPVELPAHSMLPDQLDENEMRQLIKHRHMGVSAGRLLYAEVDPLHIRSFTLDDDSRRWTLQHQVSVDLLPNGGNAKEMPLVAAVDPLDTNLLHLNVDRVNFSIDMSRKRMIESTAIPTDMSPPSESATTSYLPCVLPSFLRSSPIPGDYSVTFLMSCVDETPHICLI
uniref:DUF1618 domain-containing protein n=1 Tax=Aegilops tauschii TaxID=37682 RepID=M8C240_AEGTA